MGFKLVYFCAAFVAFGGFLFGWDSSYVNGVLSTGQFIKDYGREVDAGTTSGAIAVVDGVTYQITSTQRSLITSLLSAGTFFGAIFGGWFADKFGRILTLQTASLIYLIGCILQTAVANIPALIVFRIIAGFGVGLLSLLAPMYIAETAPARIRGSLIGLYQLFITIGILCSQGASLGIEANRTSASYRVPIGLQMLWGLILIGGSFFLVQSPRWLVKQDRMEDAQVALAKLHGVPTNDPGVAADLATIKETHEFERALGTSTYAELFRGTLLPRTMVGILVQMFQQFTGVNFIFYFGNSFFEAAGVTEPFKITLATGVVNVFMTIPGIILVEKLGRRAFLLYGAIWMSICQLIVGVVSVATDSKAGQNTLVAFTCLFIAGFAATWGPGAWVLIGELFPLKVRSKGMSLATGSNWFWNWAIAFCVPYITDAGYGNLQTKIAFIWCGTSAAAAVWTFLFVPETRYHSLEELDEMFESGVKPWHSAQWKPKGHHSAGQLADAHAIADAKISDDPVVHKEKTEV